MTKKELLQLINECIQEHNTLNEGVILGTYDIAKNIVDKFKKFYTSKNLNNDLIQYLGKHNKKFKNITTIANIKLSPNDINYFAEFLNEKFFYNLTYTTGKYQFDNSEPLEISQYIKFLKTIQNKDKLNHILKNTKFINADTPVPINISIRGENVIGSLKSPPYYYNVAESTILINVNEVFLKQNKQNKQLKQLIDPYEIDYRELTDYLDHELIHFFQYLRTLKNMSDVNKFINNKEIKLMKQQKPSYLNISDEQYAKNVDYYNDKFELMTQSKEIINSFLKKEINKYHKKYPNYSINDIKNAILQGLKTDVSSNKSSYFLNTYIKIFRFINYLTPSNKKKFFTYLYKYLTQSDYSQYLDNPSSPSTTTTKQQPIN